MRTPKIILSPYEHSTLRVSLSRLCTLRGVSTHTVVNTELRKCLRSGWRKRVSRGYGSVFEAMLRES